MHINDLTKVYPSITELALKAMTLGKCLSVLYHPTSEGGDTERTEGRIVEIHAIGLSTKGKPCVRVYQVTGGAVFGETDGWKMMKLEDMDKVHLLDIASEAPRPGYKPGDKGMGAILAEISSEPVPATKAD